MSILWSFLFVVIISFDILTAKLLSGKYALSDPDALQFIKCFIIIDTENQLITIEMSGADNKWMGIGFGSRFMDGTFTYIYHGNSMRQEAPGEMDLYTYILNARGATDSYNTKIPSYGRLSNNGETFIRYTRPFRMPGGYVILYIMIIYYIGNVCYIL